ncbi:serine hydrolase domain-containing protein [Actinoallomurus bryophytorum]|uniref:D-alanyl-D-alanine carboxypeptidase n=1 Tax=Actinoallomurus bryophytorum TaxID=1490222 RepID=A0A543CSK5_9ACTN|nr:serine hydrolase domain-containing protein [Actinoallomurus bryophytorum]TQM00097.1 D-alanyl-D-alanine carboxypeptidase [Actinoallomurus bryophytorum]
MFLRLLCGMAVGFTIIAAPPTGASGTPDVLRRDLDRLTAAGVPGALAEVRDASGSRTVTSGVADLHSRTPVRPDSAFRIFSNTKTFVATVVLQLVAEHRIALGAPVERYLPGLIRGNGNDGRRVTVRELLQHTSGLADYSDDLPLFAPGQFFVHRFDHFGPRQLVALALKHPPVATPGTSFSYSTTNYIVAGLLVEKVTGRPYGTEITDRILRPLRLRHTYVPGDRPGIPGPHARGYTTIDDRQVDATSLNPSVVWAGGEMISTADDLNRFFAALLRGSLLPPAQLAQMTTTVPADQLFPGARYGLGLINAPLSCGGSYWAHGGDGPGFETREGATRDGRQVTVMLNQSPVSQDVLTTVDDALCHGMPEAS